MSSSKPDLRVEVPPEDANMGPTSAEDSSTSSNRWNKVLQSPQVLMEKTASFTAKLAGGMKKERSSSQRPVTPNKSRTSVEPTRRAAMDAQYRTSLFLRVRLFLTSITSSLPTVFLFQINYLSAHHPVFFSIFSAGPKEPFLQGGIWRW